jgi:hypothetical protein
MRSYRTHAKNAGRLWQLTDEQANVLFQSNCHYCGVPPSNVSYGTKKNPMTFKRIPFIYNGIDRVDSAIGYVPTNVVACCKTCNFAKRHTPYAEFMAWVKRLVAYQTAR